MSRSHERRTERATAEEVAEIEHQLWEFAKRIDPPSVPEAKLRPGAFLYRVHRTWHSLGRGTGGLASRSFRALRDELLRRDPPVRNLQPKLYGNTALSHAEAEQLIDVMLETWHLERGQNRKWKAGPLVHPKDSALAENQDLETIRENLLHTLFRGEDQLLLEEPVGVPPEIFMKECGHSSKALIIPTKSETTAHLSPSNAYGGFSSLNGIFFDAANERFLTGNQVPLLIWVLRLQPIRDNAEFHQSFHSLALYSSCLTNWYYRLSRSFDEKREENQQYWDIVNEHCAFVVYGLPEWITETENPKCPDTKVLDLSLFDLGPDFFVPETLPIEFTNHRHVRRHRDMSFGINVSIEVSNESDQPAGHELRYWLFPGRSADDLEETAETTGLPVFNAEASPGKDYDLVFRAVYDSVLFYNSFDNSNRAQTSFFTLRKMGWRVMNIEQFQKCLAVSRKLGSGTNI